MGSSCAVVSGCEMACFRPFSVYSKAYPGKGITLDPRKGFGELPFKLPCGQCIGCRLDRSQEWATRLHHEATLHESNAFLTLTYSDVFLPDDYSVSVREMQLFLKRLRKFCEPVKVRFFACGEYGERNYRPHYHLLLFGYDFPDKTLWRRAPSGELLYRSKSLEKLWPFGHSEIGAVTLASAGYVARYVVKKVGGELAESHYNRVHPHSGECVSVRPEFVVMSTRPGIGRGWFDKYSGDAFPSDFLVVDGRKRPVPRYYSKMLAEKEAFLVVVNRKKKALVRADNNTPERLLVREEVQQLRAKKLKRSMEEES